MIMLSHPLLSSRQSAFALISVLALVSLAALTATAFLASARLERQATSSIGTTTRLEMTLSAGRECAAELLDKVGQPGFGWNFVTTYWRANIADELGYPLIGGANSKNNLRWTYYCGFTPATWTNLDTNFIGPFIKVTNLICQSSFSNDIAAFMTNATNGFSANPASKVSTTITLVGGRTSPPIGWVYIRQNIRTNPAATNTAYLPVARFAYFIEDLQGLIDAERMGGLTLRDTGTNAEEISMSNLTGVTITNLTNFTNARGQYITPSMLLTANGGFLSSTNDLRYFASRLRSCPFNDGINWDRIPAIPINSAKPNYPTNAGFNKRSLNTNLNSAKGLANIAYTITNNFPNFTNRAGGMNGTNYALALAANIIDYADADSSATTTNIVMPAPAPPRSVVGYDSHPLLTHLYDQFTYSNATRTITHTTWMQFWNPSTQPTIAANVTVNFTNNDIVRYTNTTITNTNRLYLSPGLTTTIFNLPIIPPNAGFVTNFTRPNIPLGGFPSFPTTTPQVWLNCQTGSIASVPCSNSFSYTIGGATIAPTMTIKRQIDTLTSPTPIFSAGFLAGNQYIAAGAVAATTLPIHDPRMTPYLGQGSGSQYAQSSYATTFWRGYISQAGLSANIGLADPAFWPDGSSRNVSTHGSLGAATAPTTGLFTNSNSTSGLDPAPCKISNFGSYTNICELGNIFDPIQWRPPATTANNYANTNIDSTWTADPVYGGGSTLRIGRPEHSRFAFTNLGGTYPTPNLGQSAVGLLDLFCVTNTYNWAGKININTAPAPVLAALAGGIKLTRDTNKAGTEVNATMINAFTNGVMRFRQTYPFITPSQLLFIAGNYGSTNWTNSWPNTAVFSRNLGLAGVTSINDEGLEEWFSKIYALTTVQSFNYRIYVVAQLTDTNGLPKGAPLKKYYQLHLRNNNPNPNSGDSASPSVSQNFTYEAFF
jgi:hypothetical protein